MITPARTVLLTRPRSSDSSFESILAADGIATLHVPMIEIQPPESWEQADDAIDAIGVYSGIVITSVNAAAFFFERCSRNGVDFATLPPVHAVGEKTAAAIRSIGIGVTVMPEKASAVDLALALGDVTNAFFLQPGADIMRPDFAQAVEARGGKVNRVQVYRTITPSRDALAVIDQRLIEGEIDCIAFFSPSAVRGFTTLLPGFRQATLLIAAIGQTTAAAVAGNGLRCDIIAQEQTAESLAHAIAERFRSDARVERDPTQFMDI